VLVFQQEREMKRDAHRNLSRRERQIMDVLFQRGQASGAEIHAALPDPPSYSAVRAALSVLEQKGHIRHAMKGLRYVWAPRLAREQARRSAVRHLVRTFFDGSLEQAAAALLDEAAAKLDDRELARLRTLIDQAGGREP
jgi:BlaI family penicillinase repressor